METPTPAAPAQPAAAPTTVSASVDAVNRNDFDAFDRAELGKRTGAPIADVPAPAPADVDADLAAPAPAADGRTISARQQKANDAIRDAVTRATKDSTDRIADLERQLAARTPATPRSEPARPDAPPVAAATTWQDAIKRPDVSQAMLSETQFFEKFPEAPYAAYARYWTGYDTAADQAQAHQRAAAEQEDTFLQERASSLTEKLNTAKAADPDFAAKLPPALLDPERSIPLSALAHGVRPTFTNVVAEALLHADNPAALALHLQANPADVERISALPTVTLVLSALARLDGRLAGPAIPESTAAPVVPAAAARSPITAAPPPPPTLRAAGSTSDPKAAALARNDFTEYDRLELEERTAKASPR